MSINVDFRIVFEICKGRRDDATNEFEITDLRKWLRLQITFKMSLREIRLLCVCSKFSVKYCIKGQTHLSPQYQIIQL